MLSQVSLEFMAFVSLLLILLSFTIYYNSSLYMQMNSATIYADAQAISDQIASEINLALKAGDGYSRIFSVPEKISGSLDYNISVEDYFVVLQFPSGYVRSTILTKSLNGTLAKGQNLIKNLNGIIYVSQ